MAADAKPKRHHWWPQLQSRYWCGRDGLIFVIRKDGTVFKGSPNTIGVEGELYTRLTVTGEKDTTIESWFATEIESPFRSALKEILDPTAIKARPFRRKPEMGKAQEMRALGFIETGLFETIVVSPATRVAVVAYLAAMIVRSPRYLEKLRDFHRSNPDFGALNLPDGAIKTVALENMLRAMRLYEERMAAATIAITFATGDMEFIFSDAGVTAKEPWRRAAIPFDIHAPLTPRVSLQLVPAALHRADEFLVSRVNNQGVRRANRITVGGAERFVFTRSEPPLEFIKSNFGVPAPAPFGHRVVNGKLETVYDPSRDRA